MKPEPPIPENHVLLETGASVQPGDLWWDFHLKRWKPVNPKATRAAVQEFERIVRKKA